ncbi:hypothetical protein F7734_51965 [Scytonema sp. UIC 10036]|uniref:hypothetical protein n=1 Tax=Scytonema sp. UIC 10036 TaxID=2304196 RepID=UPI0012DAEE1E|nr:hypothetical protein [Scytonema sp. UIC 10036]MUH00343.1 hypothetical protein [Scytonema sp. UIC 10036]
MNMTRFDPNKNQKTPDEWSAIALNRTADNNLQWNVIGGIMLGILTAGAASPLTGGLVAAYFVWDSWRKSAGIQRNQAAIVESGCVAQVLDGDDFINYTSQVGREAVLAELRYASARNLPMSNAAFDYLEDNAATPTTPALTHSNQSVPAIGQFTKLNAVDVPTTQIDTYNPKEDTQISIIDEMTDSITNSLIIGAPRSGKGMLVSNALREAKRKHPGLKVFVIDPKASVREVGYWDGVADVVKRYPCENQPDEVIVSWVEKCFDDYYEFVGENGRTLLFLDEGVAVGSAAERLKNPLIQNKITSIASLGDESGKNIWIASQSPFVNGLGIKLSASSQMLVVAIVNQNNIGMFKQWARSSILAKTSVDELALLINNSDCKRAVYFGKTGKWYSMPSLTNHSGYDRDTNTYLPGFAPPPQGEKLISDYDAIAKLEESLKAEITPHSEPTEELTEDEIALLTWIKSRKKIGKEYDANTANKNMDKLVKPDEFDSKAEYIRHLMRQLKNKGMGTLSNANQFDPI